MRTKIALQGGCISCDQVHCQRLAPPQFIVKSNPENEETRRTIPKNYRARVPLSQVGRTLTETWSTASRCSIAQLLRTRDSDIVTAAVPTGTPDEQNASNNDVRFPEFGIL
jgi:hypothetical protein